MRLGAGHGRPRMHREVRHRGDMGRACTEKYPCVQREVRPSSCPELAGGSSRASSSVHELGISLSLGRACGARAAMSFEGRVVCRELSRYELKFKQAFGVAPMEEVSASGSMPLMCPMYDCEHKKMARG